MREDLDKYLLSVYQAADSKPLRSKSQIVMQETKIKIRTRKKPTPQIKIRRRFLTVQDIKSLTQNMLKLNDYAPMQQTTIQDFFDKTNQYLRKIEPKRNNLIKIKKVKLFKSAN